MNFLTADGEKFTHPLHHLGKTAKDLPILAIDSFRHMYIWKLDPKTNIEYVIGPPRYIYYFWNSNTKTEIKAIWGDI